MSENTGRKTQPIGSRFQKGASGNPKGRPRKSPPQKSGSAFDVLIDKTLTITRNGVPQKATVEEVLQHQTYKDAIAGNPSAMKEVLRWIKKREKALPTRRKPKAGIELRFEPVDPDNANAALLLLGIAYHDTQWASERFLIAPWAVQSALNRRRGGKRLTKGEITMIEVCVGDPSALRWPRGTPE